MTVKQYLCHVIHSTQRTNIILDLFMLDLALTNQYARPIWTTNIVRQLLFDYPGKLVRLHDSRLRVTLRNEEMCALDL